MSRKKYIISTVIAAVIVTGAILLVIYIPFQTPTQPEEPFIFDLSITSHENNSLVKSSTVIIRGNSSGSPDIDEILVNGQSAISLDSNFKKWGVIMNLGPGLNQILIDIMYNITEKIENATEIWINADTNPYPKDLDRPDSSYLDMNNDGLDGMCDNAIFVSQDGSDLNSGDISHPMASIIEGIAKANESGKKDVYVSEGIYNGTVEMIDEISIYGGFIESDLWSRDESVHPIINSTKEVNNKIIGIKAHNIHSPTYLDTVEIITGNSTSGTSCGIWCYNITDFMLSINNCIIHAGNGGDGVNGADGANGQAGSAGSNGVFELPGAGGAGVYYGGNGGLGGIFIAVPGTPGLPGVLGGGPSGGSGGALGLPGFAGGNGGNGGNGANGVNGGVGNGYGTVVNNFWYGFDGNNGGHGGHGSGGGGGGGGGSNIALPSTGGGGGGGGGGGSRGLGGAGGTSGGGSIGILLVEANITITHNTIFTSNGGNGGNGGDGGIGGSGGAGGVPGAQVLGAAGGFGGSGGDGGNGGAGGGGAGGISFGVYCYNSDSLISDIVYTIGTGGSGGASSGINGNQGGSGYIFILV